MADSTRYTDWLAKAAEEVESAEILLTNNGSNAVIAFLCQQAVEKAFKGFILKNKQELIDGHSLVYLCRKAIEVDNKFRIAVQESAFLNQFYIETRYPADIPTETTKDDAQECVRIANQILKLVM
ncbi:MAG: HEPN domain-containing protein [Clostridiales bacterium]|jgi:HEPN domain-containing protein|nr:HEPN domain-containing protein [Clostridiales bacterium]